MLRSAVRTIGLTGALFSSGVFALGLGDMKLYSAVNEPLRAEIKLLKVGDLNTTQVLVKLASLQDFERANVEREFFLTGMRYEVELDGRGGGVVKVSTNDPVREPYLNFLLEAKWPSGRLVREYTLLLDLPAFTSTSNETSTALQAPQAESAPIVNNYELEEAASAPSIAPAPRPQPQVSNPVPQRQPDPVSYNEPADDSYRTQESDTLWQIASRVQPSNRVSVNQTMIALQKDNPNAFINGNINRLKVGEVLRIPDEQRIQDIANSQARLEVARQMQEWRDADADVRQIDARAEARSSVPTSASDTRGTLTLSTSAGAGINGDVDGSADPESIGLNARLTDVMAQLSSATAQNDQLSSRVQELLGEMEDLKNKLELRNSQLAQLQAQGEIDSDNLEFDSSPEASILPEDSAEDPFEQYAETGELAAADDYDSQAGAQETLEESTETEASKPAPAPAAKEAGFLDTLLSPFGLGALAGVLALLGGLFFWRRKKAADEEFEFDDADATEELSAAEPDTPRANVVGSETGFASTPIVDDDSDVAEPEAVNDSANIEAEMGDPIAEADIYVAYGRYPQAIELLNRAIEQEPQRTDLVAKLVEVHSAAGDREQAAAQLSKLETMGMGAAAVGVASAASSANDDEQAPDVMEEFQETLPDDQDMDFSDEFNEDSAPSGVDQSLIDSILGDADDEDAPDDFSNTFAAPDTETSEFNTEPEDAEEAFSLDTISAEDDGLDFGEEFDLELELDDGIDADEDVSSLSVDASSNDLSASDVREALADGNDLLDANFASHETVRDSMAGAAESEPAPFNQEEVQASGIEQGLAAVDSSFADAEADNESYALGELEALDDIELELGIEDVESDSDLGVELDIDSELSSLDDDLDESSLDVISSAELSDLELELEQTALDGDDDAQRAADVAILEADETATKLDLARAYVDMGDTDGAKDILGEVMLEGSAMDKQQAKELLDRIA